MKEIKINLNKITKPEIDLIAEYFKQGKVIAYPTDTIYGLGCLATDKKAIKRIYRIKKRNKKNPLLILASSFGMVRKYCFLSMAQERFLKNKWPGPVSVVLRAKSLLPKELTGGKGSIAVRMPKNNFLIKTIRRVGAPIVSTSLNISGKKNIIKPDNLENYFETRKPDLIINAGELKSKPSRLVDIRDINNIKILRK
ncbi:threonylcarbamoyl-AMP synthase [Patescibacteria group bacterium]|nr:threonylcarbamoyl-AMP synthase [Candidatus Falkowbacteria bacterium]MBU3906536.1 threonylcarbamoyl-AMP synthase [Patescibacteria group bacterium]MBU4015245.1 threonylcarbamoyl-AMP synthase [Patescibacteria group bacterium]MBU4026570.1 threonylcarbamoyl-AMP synthase [Patescibacteria group bacterium]MBU4073469.1 threonylcarbamoyl-AMP synthase [Patescibacteria group bacterium]